MSNARLEAIGYPSPSISDLVRRGHLHRIHRGVYAVGRRELTQLGRYEAALSAIGDDAAISHTSAGGLLEIREDRGRLVHAVVTRKVRSRPGIRVHYARSLAPDDVVERERMRVTSPMRTLVDLRDWLSSTAHEQTVATAIRKGLIEQPVNASGRRGIALSPRFTRSTYERRLLAAIRAAGLPEPLTNHRIGGWEVDFFWPQHRLALELDPYRSSTRFPLSLPASAACSPRGDRRFHEQLVESADTSGRVSGV